jgi:hypothetical protein
MVDKYRRTVAGFFDDSRQKCTKAATVSGLAGNGQNPRGPQKDMKEAQSQTQALRVLGG